MLQRGLESRSDIANLKVIPVLATRTGRCIVLGLALAVLSSLDRDLIFSVELGVRHLSLTLFSGRDPDVSRRGENGVTYLDLTLPTVLGGPKDDVPLGTADGAVRHLHLALASG